MEAVADDIVVGVGPGEQGDVTQKDLAPVADEIDAEIGSPHIRGALAAARTPNKLKKSSGSQFYIVTGKQVSAQELMTAELSKKIKYNDVQKQLYLDQGGYPNLDMEYTVFGEVLSGMEVADKISKLEKDQMDRPVKDVRMTIKLK